MNILVVFAEVFTFLHVTWLLLLPAMFLMDPDTAFVSLGLVNCLAGILIGMRTQKFRSGLIVTALFIGLGTYYNTIPVPSGEFKWSQVEEFSRLIYFVTSGFVGMALGMFFPERWTIHRVYQHALVHRVMKWSLGYLLVFFMIHQLPYAVTWRFAMVFSTFLASGFTLVRKMDRHLLRGVLLYLAVTFTCIKMGETLLSFLAFDHGFQSITRAVSWWQY